MWFNDIELPDELFQARDEGNLVIFAGAGVSYGPPSSLPLFPGLVQRIAENAATVRHPEESLDRFLGRLRRDGVMVHDRARRFLLDPKSLPNTLHDLLLRIFGKPEAIRLVTTNFDRHFTSACQTRWPTVVREYYAPALPRGASFHGIVYLHGAAFIDAKGCVLTDEDFGRAYLTEGWATEFLKDMFNRYTVLFIGYSHNDLVMNYLARGLPPSESIRRFALHSGSDDTHWIHLGIQHVPYPVKGDDHSALARIFDLWVREIESGLANSYQRLDQLAAADPTTLSKDDADFVRRSLLREDSAKRFLNLAHSPAWVTWLEENKLISSLLHAKGPVETAQQEIARWLATQFLDDDRRTLLGLIERHHRNIHPCLWFHIHLRLRFEKQQISEASFRMWIGVLISESPSGSKEWFSDLVLPAGTRKDMESLLLLLDSLVTPRIRLQESFFAVGEKPEPTTFATLDLLQGHEDHWLREAWEKIMQPALPTIGPRVDIIIRRALMRADQLIRSPDMAAS